MARYFFDVHDGFDLRDEVGHEVDDQNVLRQKALEVIASLAVAEGKDSDGYTIVLNVRDDQGGTALTVRMVCQVDGPALPRLELAS